MPDGVVQWFDAATGEAAVVKGTKVLRAAAGELEPAARQPGARVHFDIERDRGAERAVRVRLRRPGRAPRGASLAGARRPDEKGTAPFARAHPERGGGRRRPTDVVLAWAAAVEAGAVDEALALYASDAVVHEQGVEHRGRRHLRAVLEAGPLLGAAPQPPTRGEGDGDVVVLRWQGDGRPAVEVRSRVAHGQVAEQWIGAGVARATPPAPRPALDVAVHGAVPPGDVADARRRVARALGRGAGDRPATLVLRHEPDPARDRPDRAQLTVDRRGEVLRATGTGASMRDAVDELLEHLEDQRAHRADR